MQRRWDQADAEGTLQARADLPMLAMHRPDIGALIIRLGSLGPMIL